MGIKQPGDVLIFTKHSVVEPDGTVREREAEIKGDVAGHAFHGNRFTGGIGGEVTISETHGGVTTTTTSLATDPAIQALHEYQRAGYDKMNERLRQGGGASTQVKALDSLMKPLGTSRTLYRAIGEGGLARLVSTPDSPNDFAPSRDLSEQELHDRLAALKGYELTDKGFTSTTEDREVAGAKAQHGSVLVEIDAGAETQGIDIVGRKLGDRDFNFEREVLLARGQKYMITGVSDQKVDGYGTEYPEFVLHMKVARH